jgi:hypothetical protein
VQQSLRTFIETLRAAASTPDTVTVLDCSTTVLSGRKGNKSWWLNLAATSSRQPQVLMAAIDLSDLSRPRWLGFLTWNGSAYTASLKVEKVPSRVLFVSSGWGYAVRQPAVR